MKKLTGIIFIVISCVIVGKSSDSILEFFKDCKDKECIDLLDIEKKEKLLFLRRQYFSELRVLQEMSRELRKQANEYMVKNNESEYEKVYKKINMLKVQKKMLKEDYRKQIDQVLNKKNK